ncbi:hypothetical protein [Streptococcus henryi]|jgi:hypothetical protein|nr:hypothetical protein [Streptococcus henryi]
MKKIVKASLIILGLSIVTGGLGNTALKSSGIDPGVVHIKNK